MTEKWGCLAMFDHRRLSKNNVCLSVPCGKHTKNYGTLPFLMAKSTSSMAIFNVALTVCLPGRVSDRPVPQIEHGYGNPWVSRLPRLEFYGLSISMLVYWGRD